MPAREPTILTRHTTYSAIPGLNPPEIPGGAGRLWHPFGDAKLCPMSQAASKRIDRREIFGWAMFDFANSSYTTVIVTVVFSVIFPRLIVGDGPDYALGNLLWSVALSVSYGLVVLTAHPGRDDGFPRGQEALLVRELRADRDRDGDAVFREPGRAVGRRAAHRHLELRLRRRRILSPPASCPTSVRPKI